MFQQPETSLWRKSEKEGQWSMDHANGLFLMFSGDIEIEHWPEMS